MKKMERDKDFLFDIEFMEWRLFRTEEQDLYWERFREEHPECKEALDVAISKFKTVKINDFRLSKSEDERLYQRILTNIHRKRMRRRKAYWSAAAGIALLIASSLFIKLQYIDQPVQKMEAIIGQTMPSNDILLISGEKVVELKQNAQITLNEGHISVIEESNVSEMPLSENEMNKLIVPAGKRTSLELPDGTKIWLNSGTELDFPSKFTGSTREISVKGEIYIEAVKDENRPFIVKTALIEVKVLGTDFNVNAYPQEQKTEVALVSGLVHVTGANRQVTVLQPNHVVEIDHNTEQQLVRQVDITDYTCWKEGFLQFQNEKLEVILRRIERYYDIPIIIETRLEEYTITGKLDLKDNITGTLDIIRKLAPVKYRLENNKVYIYK